MKYLSLLFIAVISTPVIFSSGCKKNKNEAKEFLIYVDSIQVADTIMPGDTLEVTFFGTIGPNGCYSFNRFDVDFSDHTIDISAIGSFSGGDVCPEILPKLDGAILSITNLSIGTYSLIIKQPDDTRLTREVIVAGLPD